MTGALPSMGNTHIMLFEADYAFIMADGQTLYSAASGDWVAQSSPQSYTVTEIDTEILLDWVEIKATSPVSMLVYIEDGDGVKVVLPTEARKDGKRVIVGQTAFVGSFY